MLKYIIASSLIFLAGCSTLKVDSHPVDKLPLNLSDPEPLKLEPVKFIIINKDNAGAVFDELEKAGLQPVLIGLTGSDYKALAINVESIKNYLILHKEILRKYRNYYEPKTR